MTAATLRLGRYVRVRERVDGTHNVLFTVPPRYRPTNWRSSISLPEYGWKVGSLRDPDFRRRVMADASRLNADLDRRQARQEWAARATKRRIPELADLYFRSEDFTRLSEDAKYRNQRDVGFIIDWSESRNHPDFETIYGDEVTEMLGAFADRPFARLGIRSAWNVLSNCAIAAGWRSDHPAQHLGWKAPQPAAVHVWTQPVVDRYAEGAMALGEPGLAALIRVQFFIGQRLGDARRFQHGVHYKQGRLGGRQSKTNGLVGTALPRHLREAIEEQASISFSRYLFNHGDTRREFSTNAQLSRKFVKLRHSILKEGDPVHVLRTLRHSAVCEMAKSGLTTIQIAARTGHKIDEVEDILLRYLLDREGVADGAAIQQHVASGGSEDDFILIKDREVKDWLGDPAKLPYYHPLAPKIPKKRGRPRKTPAPTPHWVDNGLSDDDCREWGAAYGIG